MAERDGYIPGIPCWIDTTQPDPNAACAFYAALFGWELENAMPPGSPSDYFMARIRGGDVAAIGSIPPGAPATATWNTYISVENADETAAKARAAGGQVLGDPFDVMSAGRMAVLADPAGATFCVWQANEHHGARIVNEHGALNFNNLVTRDPAGAEAFYGAVFGWQTLTMPAGLMWTRPGYGDHLEEKTPGLRDQIAQLGAPEGFIDVVAALNPIPDDDSTTAPHWGVTFGVDDVAATVEATERLGGQVISGPVDAPWTRMATIKDPQGATFVAGQFVPENRDVAR
jgi:uncharacterized protein